MIVEARGLFPVAILERDSSKVPLGKPGNQTVKVLCTVCSLFSVFCDRPCLWEQSLCVCSVAPSIGAIHELVYTSHLTGSQKHECWLFSATIHHCQHPVVPQCNRYTLFCSVFVLKNASTSTFSPLL